MTTVLRFATIFVSPASPTQVRRSANRTIADACEHKRNDLASPPGPLDPNLKTGTLLLRIREKFTYVHTTFMQSALSFLYSGPDQLEPHIYNTCSACTPVHVHALPTFVLCTYDRSTRTRCALALFPGGFIPAMAGQGCV